MNQTIYQVDAFASAPFKGNPAAVCVLEEAAKESWMQNVAMEMNLSETAFLYPHKNGYNLRWFTPTAEVDLCGHATLASAFVLYETGLLSPKDIAVFYTKSGLLTAQKKVDLVELDFPATPAIETAPPQKLITALGAAPIWTGKNNYDFLIQLKDENSVRQLAPDFSQLAKCTNRGVIVTSLSEAKEYDFVSRFFAPAAGINEDPVTGSAHCTLGPFWAERLRKKVFKAYQASKRGGFVQVQVKDNRILLGGPAVTVLKGEFYF